jgi:hypothetical protein
MRHLPGKAELIALCLMAGFCTIGISMMHAKDTGLFLFSFPLFVTSAVLGLWKSGRLRPDDDSRSETEG